MNRPSYLVRGTRFFYHGFSTIRSSLWDLKYAAGVEKILKSRRDGLMVENYEHGSRVDQAITIESKLYSTRQPSPDQQKDNLVPD